MSTAFDFLVLLFVPGNRPERFGKAAATDADAIIIDLEDIGEVGFGVVMPIGERGADITRTALLLASYDDEIAGYQLNRFCTSALDTLRLGFGLIASGQARATIGGGLESMSRVAIGSDGGAVYSDPAVTARFPYIPNGVAADLMATLYGFDRESLDRYALRSQQRAAAARAEGRFAGSLVPVRDPHGTVVLEQDEAIRPGTTMKGLGQLKPAFTAAGEDGFDAVVLKRYTEITEVRHLHTAASSSAIVDGACAVLLGDRAFGERNGLRPQARLRASVSCASEPLLSLGGPIPATRQVLVAAGMAISEIDLFEVNEAFSVVPLRYQQVFELDDDQLNVNGGAIVMGHPLGATGAILVGNRPGRVGAARRRQRPGDAMRGHGSIHRDGHRTRVAMKVRRS